MDYWPINIEKTKIHEAFHLKGDSNYLQWSRNMKQILTIYGLWPLIANIPRPGVPPVESNKWIQNFGPKNQSIPKWILNQRALDLLYSNIAPSIRQAIRRSDSQKLWFNNCRLLWEVLKFKYSNSDVDITLSDIADCWTLKHSYPRPMLKHDAQQVLKSTTTADNWGANYVVLTKLSYQHTQTDKEEENSRVCQLHDIRSRLGQYLATRESQALFIEKTENHFLILDNVIYMRGDYACIWHFFSLACICPGSESIDC